MAPHPQDTESLSFGKTFLRWVLRLLVGGIIFGSALGKSLDFAGFVDILETYQAFPNAILEILAGTIIIGEFVLGTWILSGYQLGISALLGALMNMVYAIWMTITLLRGLELPNCGCFGVFFPQPLTWHSPLEDLALVTFCGLLTYLAPRSST